ncbi:MAG: diaminopimelate decarboxylase [Myxococcales bacterium]|nr:diaminopimelate decarboxylase [Myxococcales bacterium]
MGFERDESGAALLGGVRLAALFDDPSSFGVDGAPLSTPAYVYDLDAIAGEARALREAFGGLPHLVAFAIKANSAGPIVRALAAEGAGADVVSGGELALALACGIPPEDVVYSGVAKQAAELDRAIGAGPRGILSIQAESIEELTRIDERARAAGRRARVSLRINPGVEADTHAYIATGHDEAKFGIPKAEIGLAVERIQSCSNVELVGVSSHIGSQLTTTDAYIQAARMLLTIASSCDVAMTSTGRPALTLVDFGGGFGIDYGQGCDAHPADFARALAVEVRRAGRESCRTLIEPGRSLVGSHGVLCAGVVMQKRAKPNDDERTWLIVDAGMNDLLRPALYHALHRIEPLERAADAGGLPMRVVGPVCESSDDFGTHVLPQPPPRRVVIRDAGAYGFTMASEYNGRALPTEVFLRGGRVDAVIRPRGVDAWVKERLG